MPTAFPLDRLTSFGVGGPADRFVVPETPGDLMDAIRGAVDRGEPVRALGGGKNLLVDDRGVTGTVISLSKMKTLEFSGNRVRAGAGVSIASLVAKAAARGLSGLECLAGVPGTVGGAVRMNAGGAHGAIGESVSEVLVFALWGEPIRFDRRACGFGYRTSRLAGTFICEVTLVLQPAESRDVVRRTAAILADKRASQPLSTATAGCMFKNPDRALGASAGRLLDQAGMKGHERGGARFSPMHANFIENLGGARFGDILGLAREGRERVYDRFGIDLELEVEVWRREDDPEEDGIVPKPA